MDNLDDSRPYIWLRYATQYTKDGRSHTVEMSIPVPLGANAETRTQLFREAEAGMQQLINHVEQPVLPTVQRAQPVQSTTAISNQAARPVPPQRPAGTDSRSAPPPQAPPASPVPVEREQAATRNSAAAVPPNRPGSVGASMPQAFGMGENTTTMSLPEFIQYIKENLDLTPRQAMDILKVRSLSSGINLRDALEHLKQLIAQGGSVAADQRAEPTPPSFARNGPIPASQSAPNTGTVPRRQQDDLLDTERDVVQMREARPSYGFDEEIDAEETPEDELEDFEMQAPAFSPQMLEKAHSLIDELRESQGATTASVKRLQVLDTVALSQVSAEQLQELVEGIWGFNSLKKLKVDQAESLISWSKQDYFVEEMEAVLALLEEERYARGNR